MSVWITFYTLHKRWAARTLFPFLMSVMDYPLLLAEKVGTKNIVSLSPVRLLAAKLSKKSIIQYPPPPHSFRFRFPWPHLSSNVGTKTKICQVSFFLCLSQQKLGSNASEPFCNIYFLIDMEGINNLMNIMIECSEHKLFSFEEMMPSL